jgi:amino acid transporter
VLLAALVISYRQVIEAFPNGGGAYAVSQRHLGKVPALVAAANMWGIAEAARIFMVPTIAFIVAIFAVIAVGLARAHPAADPGSRPPGEPAGDSGDGQ